jgi:DNA-binding MarR family transcriptional regulator
MENRYLTPKDIAHKMNVVKSRVTRILDGLIKKNFIQRLKDPEDSRISLLSLTSDGQNKLCEINEFMNNAHVAVLSQMEPEQRQTMLTNLEILRASMEAVKDLMI